MGTNLFLDSIYEADPIFRTPQYAAPNLQTFAGGPHGTAPPILNTQVLKDAGSKTIFENLIFSEYEWFLRKDCGQIKRGENFGAFYKREFAVAHRLGSQPKKHLDSWTAAHPYADGNRQIEYARTLGSPLTDPSEVKYKKARLACGRMVVMTNVNPAIFDIRLREYLKLFPQMLTPMLTDYKELYKLGLPSEVKHNGPFAWTATGIPGFVDFWRQPSEFF